MEQPKSIMQYSDENKHYILKLNNDTYTIQPNDVATSLGEGTYGIVYLAKNSKGVLVAIKVIKTNNEQQENCVKEEISTLQKLAEINHYNIIYLVDYAEDNNTHYLASPYYNSGSLTALINKNLITDEKQAIEYFRQILYGIMKLHSLGILHRDIKTDNILINQISDSSYAYPHLLAIADLGLSKGTDAASTVNVGTEYTMAPEVKTGKYDIKADIYSLGCIFYKMLTKKELFSGTTSQEVEKSKKREKIEIKSAFVKKLSMLSLLILEQCLQYNANNRIDEPQLLSLLKVKKLYESNEMIEIAEPTPIQSITLTRPCLQYKIIPGNALIFRNEISPGGSVVTNKKNNQKGTSKYIIIPIEKKHIIKIDGVNIRSQDKTAILQRIVDYIMHKLYPSSDKHSHNRDESQDENTKPLIPKTDSFLEKNASLIKVKIEAIYCQNKAMKCLIVLLIAAIIVIIGLFIVFNDSK